MHIYICTWWVQESACACVCVCVCVCLTFTLLHLRNRTICYETMLFIGLYVMKQNVIYKCLCVCVCVASVCVCVCVCV